MRCEIKKGIFVLHTCDAKSFVACTNCHRSVCANHIDKTLSSRIICVECAAKEYQQHNAGKPPMLNKTYENLDNLWYYTARSSFHTSYPHYKPFSAKEQREFEQPLDNRLDSVDLNEEASSFLDS